MNVPTPAPYQPVCRICHSPATPETKLVTPCNCRGTCSTAHATCLEEWISRRIRSGQSLPHASTCEICLQPYAHDLHAPPALAFLLGAGSWARWAHVAYMGFVGRRLAFETRLVARLVRVLIGGLGDGKGKGRAGDLLGRAAFSTLMAVHYGLFLVLDLRHLVAQFRAWRAVSCRVVVRDRVVEVDTEGQGEDAV